MSQQVGDKTVFSLLEVTRSIQKTIAERYKKSYWIKAEMIKLNRYDHSGHCYPDLVEKKDGRVIAQLRATLWRDDYQRANNNFIQVLKEPLKDGIKILFMAKISFHPEYGLTLQILDIDPTFTLGDLEQEKIKTIEQLKYDNLYDANRKLKLPVLPKRIAIISVETSKGYADFLQVLEGAKQHWGYAFFNMLFPSLLQGDNAVHSILNQLSRIRKVARHFDVVAIIRGGGGDVGLSCYNNYELSKAVAEFPIPVISGIGHATNQTVVEMVSHENAITPTKLAEFLIQHFHDFSIPLQRYEEKIVERSKVVLDNAGANFKNEVQSLKKASRSIIQMANSELKEQLTGISTSFHFQLRQERLNLKSELDNISKGFRKEIREKNLEIINIEKNIRVMDPQNVLKRGYSYTLSNGKPILSTKQIKEGDELTTVVARGEIKSKVTSKKEEDHE